MEQEKGQNSYFKGHFLIAMPSLTDPNFCYTVTYIAEHTAQGAMGLIINRVHPDLNMDALFVELKLSATPKLASLPLYLGGPVHTGQIFILHVPPFGWEACQPVNSKIALSNSMDLVEVLAKGNGPESYILTLGCAGWGPGQLESEIMDNAWLSCPAKESIIFNVAVEKRWEEAAKLIGIDPARLTNVVGHA